MNNCSFVGRATRDGEFRYASSGTQILSFTLAVDGRQKGETEFIDHTFFGERAEKIASWVTKGRLLATTGRLNIRSYEAKDGTKKKQTQIIVSDVQFLDRSKADDISDLGREVDTEEAPF